MTADDAANNSSFNQASKWSSGAAASSGNTYQTTHIMRSPANGSSYLTGTFTFGGDSLQFDSGSRLLGKTGPVTLVVNNVSGNPGGIILNGGYLDEAANSGNVMTLQGVLTVNAASGLGAFSTSGQAYLNILDVQSVINGSAALTISGSGVNSGSDGGTVKLSAVNTYSGTITVANNYVGSSANGLLQLNNANALRSATLANANGALNTTAYSPVTFASGIGTFNIGALSGSGTISAIALVDTASAAVILNVGSNNASTAYSGALNGGGSLVKSGTATLTLSGANGYTGNTTISGGTLALSGSGSLASANISVSSGATFDVSAQTTPTLAANQNLLGGGSVNGSLTTVATTKIYPGTDGTEGTLTFNNSLTLNAGTTVKMDLSSTYNGSNDKFVLSGNSAVLTPNGAAIAINSAGTLDTVNDYVLMDLTGTGASISGSFNIAPVFTGTTPVNSGNYQIVTTSTQVKLHYGTAVVLSGVGAATPGNPTHGQTTLLTVTVTPATSPNSTGLAVSANLGSIGGSSSQIFYDDGTHGDGTAGDNVFSYSHTVPAGTSPGAKVLICSVTDAQSRSASPGISLTVMPASLTWVASPVDANWGTLGNWDAGMAPAEFDILHFGSSSQTAPNLETGYNIDSVTFDSGASLFTIGGSTLTLTGGVTNNSTGVQTISTPVSLSSAQTVNAASGGIVFSGTVSGGSLTKLGGGALTLSGNNGYSGGTTLSAGQLNINNSSAIGTGTFTISGGALDNTSAGTINLGSIPIIWSGDFTYVGSLTRELNLGNGTVTLSAGRNVTVNGGTLTVGGNISGTGFGLNKSGSGTLKLLGTNTQSGITLMSGGTLAVGNNSALGTGPINFNSGTITAADTNSYVLATGFSAGINSGVTIGVSASGDLTFSGNWAISGSTAYKLINVGNNNTTFSGVISSGGVLGKGGSGNMILSGQNTYSGGTSNNAGTLTLANAKAIGTGVLTMNGGNLDSSVPDLVNTNNNVQNWNADFSFLGSQNLDLGTGGVTLGASRQVSVSANTLAVGGVISGVGFDLTKTGAGTLALYGANTFTGSTIISVGTLALKGSGSLASVNISVATNAIFDVSAAAGGSYNLNNFGTLTLAAIKAGSTLTNGYVKAPATLNAGGTLTVTTTGDALADGDTFHLFNVQPAGSFSSTPSLPSGANWWTTDNYQHITWNVWPIAGNTNFTHPRGISVRFSVADLLTNVSGAIAGKTITVTALGNAGVSGATVQTNGPLSSSSTLILYTPASTDNNDSFSYTVSDGRGGSATGTVYLTADTSAVFGQQSPQMSVDGGGNIQVKFYGVPGYTYIIQRSTDMANPNNWSDIYTNSIPLDATSLAISYTDAPGSSAFYRLKWQP